MAPTSPQRIDVVDPSAYTPPYDHALCAALARAGARVRLQTSHFPYGPVPAPEGYERVERFYGGGGGGARVGEVAGVGGGGSARALAGAGSRRRRMAKLAQHVPDMLRYRRAALDADVVHFQWLSVQQLDVHLLPRGRPLALTAHDVLPREPRRGQLAAQRRLYERVDAVVVHSEHGRARLVDALAIDPAKVRVIEHGAFEHLTRVPGARPLPVDLAAVDKPVVLFFGLLRPYKGLDVLLAAWGSLRPDAELWIVGRPRMDVSALRAAAGSSVRWVSRFVADDELAAYFERADLVVLPYREIDQSGVLFTALAFGSPLLLSDVGGFGEVAAQGAAALVAPGDANALAAELARLLADPAARAALSTAARHAASTRYSWDEIARRHLELYGDLMRS